MEVEHQIAKLLVEVSTQLSQPRTRQADEQVSKSQDDEIGDGTTGVVGKLPFPGEEQKLTFSPCWCSPVSGSVTAGPGYPPYPYSRWLREGL
jgi:hypothetical protein